MKGAEQKQPKRKEIDKIRRKKVNAGAFPRPPNFINVVMIEFWQSFSFLFRSSPPQKGFDTQEARRWKTCNELPPN